MAGRTLPLARVTVSSSTAARYPNSSASSDRGSRAKCTPIRSATSRPTPRFRTRAATCASSCSRLRLTVRRPNDRHGSEPIGRPSRLGTRSVGFGLHAARGALIAALTIVPLAAPANERIPMSAGRGVQPGTASAASTPIPTAEWFRLQNQQPGPGTTVKLADPAISASFSDKVNASSVAVSMDGRDVTRQARVTTNAFCSNCHGLPEGTRTVTVSGMTIGGQQFVQS